MGCGLRKLRPSEDSSPGKIYSTLKRPQVETKVGVAYTYRFLDFLIGQDEVSSPLRLSSVWELPSLLQDQYQQGFLLVALHPFIHPGGPGPAQNQNQNQNQLYRAVLVRLNDGSERTPPLPAGPPGLRVEACLSADRLPSPELIQGYVKKQIQDAADQGVMFVGFVQEPHGAPPSRTTQREPETPSLSLHSSPSSVLGSLGSCGPLTPQHHGGPGPLGQAGDPGAGEAEGGDTGGENHHDGGPPHVQAAFPEDQGQGEKDALTHNNNKANATQRERPAHSGRIENRAELLALFNHPLGAERQLKYFTVKVPLRVQLQDQGLRGLEANWLDHMTQHFNNGAELVDGYFHLGHDNDLLPKAVESVFIFQEGAEGDSAPVTYDAIVVEQWTVIDGLQVKTDYVPLLQSLAVYGWRLTCVLPTPITKSNSDGSLSTKQIVFLQRPVLPNKKREPKKLTFKNRNKNFVRNEAKKKRKRKPWSTEAGPDEPIREEERSSDRGGGGGEEEEEGRRAELEMNRGEEGEEPGEKGAEPRAGEGSESRVETGRERDEGTERGRGGAQRYTGGGAEHGEVTEGGASIAMETKERAVGEGGVETDRGTEGEKEAGEGAAQEAVCDGQVTLTNQSPGTNVESEE